MSGPLRVGIVGVGNISTQYFEQLQPGGAPRYESVRIEAVADLDDARASAVATERGVRAMTLDELFASPDIDLVLNLTIPAAHADVDLRAIAAGKHAYGEKPLALDVASGRAVLAAAEDAGLLVGSAPDTVLGTGIQTARALLDAGELGTPIGAQVHWSSPGHERWHPAPDFFYQPGAGPLYDMGPYYLTALVTLFGPIARVAGASTRSDRARTIATGPRAGEAVPVAIDTHVSALLVHVSGVAVTLTVSFEEWATRTPLFEVYGSEGTVAVPDPNRFADPVEVFAASSGEWTERPASAGFPDAGRGVGIVDLADALATGRAPRASGELALHVLEAMEAIASGTPTDLTTRPERPAAVSTLPTRP